MKRFSSLTLTAALLLAAASCSDDGPLQSRIAQTDIVTLLDSGAPARFRLDSLADTGSAELVFAGVKLDGDLTGERMLLRYYPATATETPRALGVSLINTGAVHTVALDTVAWNSNPVEMIAMWPTGDWLNMRLRLPNSSEPRIFRLVADESTLSTPCPVLYLDHDLLGATPGYLFETYASWDISSVLALPGCDSLTVRVNDASSLSASTTIANYRNPKNNKKQ